MVSIFESITISSLSPNRQVVMTTDMLSVCYKSNIYSFLLSSPLFFFLLTTFLPTSHFFSYLPTLPPTHSFSFLLNKCSSYLSTFHPTHPLFFPLTHKLRITKLQWISNSLHYTPYNSLQIEEKQPQESLKGTRSGEESSTVVRSFSKYAGHLRPTFSAAGVY